MSGIKPITLFDASAYRCRYAGEISDFRPAEFLGSKGLRTLDRTTRLALVAAKLAQFSRGIRVAAGITVLLAGLWLINFGFDLSSTILNPPPVLADCFYEGNCPICYFEGTCNEYGFPLKPGEETLYSP